MSIPPRLLLVFVSLFATAGFAADDYPIHPVPFFQVTVRDDFWAPRIRRNHEVTIPIALKQCYDTGRVDNFLKAAHVMPGEFGTEFPFDDTDIYKILEGASYSLQTFPDPKLEAEVDKLIEIIRAAQEPDGYLYTSRTINPHKLHKWISAKRWEADPKLSHELYNCGHLYEAAAAHFQATGKRTLLDIALKNADLLCHDFGPGRAAYYPGHQIVEMGLVKLYRVTGKREYLDLAKYFLDIRHGGETYNQAHLPVTEQKEAVGHSVRATYMFAGMADVAALTGDRAYLKATDAIWDDIVWRKLYLTGGIGAVGGHEGFGGAYELPNAKAYNETCASIGMVYWNAREFYLHGQARYFDVLERTLYNGVLSGVSLSGDRFFYPNPLAADGKIVRQAWFGCACCPSNICRFIPSIPGYVYATTPERVYANLYVGSEATLRFGSHAVRLTQRTAYPWSGDVEIVVDPAGQEPAGEFELALRIPGWARDEAIPSDLYAFANPAVGHAVVTVNGKPVTPTMEHGYAVLRRSWQAGDRVQLALPMEIRLVKAHASIADDVGRFALHRGPLVYCVEGVDLGGSALAAQLPPLETLRAERRDALLDGITVITAEDGPFTAIPYFAWANRAPSEMAVWLEPAATSR
ncbi:glycoside hydrolase family 127 protein [Opitutus terrae]|uniref:Glycoside hydrolase family 127 protein n=1 Tax=Opitutus terrae (strain DSM 11246 / JCM 15787 / PB90-1) TaxID=452637 RepID=B1ZUU3_OPITP|nr:glycoside hydrolase family 127 protein [Opitutus terrae]ACB74980.1 protein of unknown function DUF1680 [Opitutus terrae PB90-1]